MNNEHFWGSPISVYTRAQAIDDGVLVDLTERGRAYGFKIPLACTEAAWNAVAWSDHIEARKPEATGQSTEGRLHDVLSLARMGANAAAHAGMSVVDFEALLVPTEGTSMLASGTAFRITVSGGDVGEPVLTLMIESED